MSSQRVEDTPNARRHPKKRDAIVRAALALADRDGYEAVSMRRVADELGWGTMTLYSYVRGKDELVWHMGEALGGELLVPAEGAYESSAAWAVEGHGVEPDIVVRETPTELAEGRDPQLEAAVRHLLEELEGHQRPATPLPPGH